MQQITQVLIVLLFCNNLFSQDSSDAERLSDLDYMKYADKINCDGTDGSNLEHKVCLNLEFQELDSILNLKYTLLLKKIEGNRIKDEIIKSQHAWILNRRNKSKLESTGFQGHTLGIYYLSAMIEITKKRIKEIESMLLN